MADSGQGQNVSADDSERQGTASSLMNEILQALGMFKWISFKTFLPSDKLGFWLTQGVPTGLIVAHILMQFVGESDLGVCFIPSTKDNPLGESQIQYITQFCLSQRCFDNGFLKDECIRSTGSLCDMNTTATDSNNNIDFFRSLFIYRNYVWFLSIFAFLRGVPQILWGLYFGAEIALAIAITIKWAESEHSGDNSTKKDLQKLLDNNGGYDKKDNKDKKYNTNEKGKNRPLFGVYVFRKLVEIVIDVVIIALIATFLQTNHTPYHKLVFVCDLHSDLDNILLCDTIKKRFISCTVTFGFESIMTICLSLGVVSIDFVFQTLLLIHLTCRRLVKKCKSFFNSLKQSNCIECSGCCEGDKTSDLRSIHSLNDLHLISMLQKQNRTDKDSLLNIIKVEKMIRKMEMENTTRNEANTENPQPVVNQTNPPQNQESGDGRDAHELDTNRQGRTFGYERLKNVTSF